MYVMYLFQLASYAKTALKIFKNDSNAHKLWSLDKPLNHVQSEAIKNAIKHPFYLIQGPPGKDYLYSITMY